MGDIIYSTVHLMQHKHVNERMFRRKDRKDEIGQNDIRTYFARTSDYMRVVTRPTPPNMNNNSKNLLHQRETFMSQLRIKKKYIYLYIKSTHQKS